MFASPSLQMYVFVFVTVGVSEVTQAQVVAEAKRADVCVSRFSCKLLVLLFALVFCLHRTCQRAF